MTSAPRVDATYDEGFNVGVGSDSIVYNPPLRALWIGAAGAGGLRVLTASGQDITFASIPAGFLLPLNCSKVFATSTTVTGIIGLR